MPFAGGEDMPKLRQPKQATPTTSIPQNKITLVPLPPTHYLLPPAPLPPAHYFLPTTAYPPTSLPTFSGSLPPAPMPTTTLPTFSGSLGCASSSNSGGTPATSSLVNSVTCSSSKGSEAVRQCNSQTLEMASL